MAWGWQAEWNKRLPSYLRDVAMEVSTEAESTEIITCLRYFKRSKFPV